jgi:hypothetical protein
LRGYFSFGLPFKRRYPISLRSSERSIFVRQTRGVDRFFPLLPWTWYPRVPQCYERYAYEGATGG